MNQWKAGASKIKITPKAPFWLAGYSVRAPAIGVLQDIHARALAIEDERGDVSVLVSIDLVGLDRSFVERIARFAQEHFGLPRERLVLNVSHNHSGPVTRDVLPTYYALDKKNEDSVNLYTDWLFDQIVKVIGEAMQCRVPVELSFGQGLAGFGVNRRRARDHTRHLSSVVDPDVPVLRVQTVDGDVLALVFGYACHATTVSDEMLHGDYPGFAQTELEERYPGAIALFVTGCAGDIDPMPRFREELPQVYGNILANAVEGVRNRNGSG